MRLDSRRARRIATTATAMVAVLAGGPSWALGGAFSLGSFGTLPSLSTPTVSFPDDAVATPAPVPAPELTPALRAKLSNAVHDRMTRNLRQDVMVVFDDREIQAEADALRAHWRLPFENRAIRQFKKGRFARLKQAVWTALPARGVRVLDDWANLPTAYVRVTSASALQALVAQSGVRFVQEIRTHQPMLSESLPKIGQIRAEKAGRIGAGTTVAVIDDGVDYTHEDFGSCAAPGEPGCRVVESLVVYWGQEMVPASEPAAPGGHGSNVAAIVAGVAPGADIIAIDAWRYFRYSDTALSATVDWLIENRDRYNIVAVNMSLGAKEVVDGRERGIKHSSVCDVGSPGVFFDRLFSSLEQARLAGIQPIASAGNDGYTDGIGEPACSEHAVAVGGVIEFGNREQVIYNSAEMLDLLAPATAEAGGDVFGGTSQAAPHVAGAWAALRSAFPAETLDDTLARLVETGLPITDERNGITRPRIQLDATLGLEYFLAFDGRWTNASHRGYGWSVGDFNGDGVDDILRPVTHSGGAEVFLSTGESFADHGRWTSASHRGHGWYVGDFNGDGADDILREGSSSGDAEVLVSRFRQGSKSFVAWNWSGTPSPNHGGFGWYVGDFDGDGKDDIFRETSRLGGVEVFRSYGRSFARMGRRWTGAGHGGQGWRVGDFNGDGRDDILRQGRTGGAEVFLSTGSHFVYAGGWTAAGHRGYGWRVADLNGDSRDDLFRRVDRRGGVEVFLSDGASFAYAGRWTAASAHGYGWSIGDFDGDGADDVFRQTSPWGGAEAFLVTPR